MYYIELISQKTFVDILIKPRGKRITRLIYVVTEIIPRWHCIYKKCAEKTQNTFQTHFICNLYAVQNIHETGTLAKQSSGVR